MKKLTKKQIDHMAQSLIWGEKFENMKLPSIQYCIVTKDKVGQTIQIFQTLQQAKQFIKLLIKNK